MLLHFLKEVFLPHWWEKGTFDCLTIETLLYVDKRVKKMTSLALSTSLAQFDFGNQVRAYLLGQNFPSCVVAYGELQITHEAFTEETHLISTLF